MKDDAIERGGLYDEQELPKCTNTPTAQLPSLNRVMYIDTK